MVLAQSSLIFPLFLEDSFTLCDFTVVPLQIKVIKTVDKSERFIAIENTILPPIRLLREIIMLAFHRAPQIKKASRNGDSYSVEVSLYSKLYSFGIIIPDKDLTVIDEIRTFVDQRLVETYDSYSYLEPSGSGKQHKMDALTTDIAGFRNKVVRFFKHNDITRTSNIFLDDPFDSGDKFLFTSKWPTAIPESQSSSEIVGRPKEGDNAKRRKKEDISS